MGLDNEKGYPMATEAIQSNFCMDDFIKSVQTPEETIEFFNQLQLFLSQHAIELKKWISNNDAVIEAIPEDWCQSPTRNNSKFEVEPNIEGSSVLGLLWTVTDDSLQSCRGTNKEVEESITQKNIFSLVFSDRSDCLLRSAFTWDGFWKASGQRMGNIGTTK